MFGFLRDHPRPPPLTKRSDTLFLDRRDADAVGQGIARIGKLDRLSTLNVVLPQCSVPFPDINREYERPLSDMLGDDDSYLCSMERLRIVGEHTDLRSAVPTVPTSVAFGFGRCLRELVFERVHLQSNMFEPLVNAQHICLLELRHTTGTIPNNCDYWLGPSYEKLKFHQVGQHQLVRFFMDRLDPDVHTAEVEYVSAIGSDSGRRLGMDEWNALNTAKMAAVTSLTITEADLVDTHGNITMWAEMAKTELKELRLNDVIFNPSSYEKFLEYIGAERCTLFSLRMEKCTDRLNHDQQQRLFQALTKGSVRWLSLLGVDTSLTRLFMQYVPNMKLQIVHLDVYNTKYCEERDDTRNAIMEAARRNTSIGAIEDERLVCIAENLGFFGLTIRSSPAVKGCNQCQDLGRTLLNTADEHNLLDIAYRNLSAYKQEIEQRNRQNGGVKRNREGDAIVTQSSPL